MSGHRFGVCPPRHVYSATGDRYRVVSEITVVLGAASDAECIHDIDQATDSGLTEETPGQGVLWETAP